MDKNDIINLVGQERYYAECKTAMIDAARADYGRGDGVVVDLPHEISDYIWYASISDIDKIRLLFAFYDDMPAYGHLMYAEMHYDKFTTNGRTRWWEEVRLRLGNGNVALRQPLQYSLWCGFFEHPTRQVEAWHALTDPTASTEVISAVLRVSGPVDYSLKANLYERLLPLQEWHEPIADSLYWSLRDYFGQIEKPAARRLLNRLKLESSRLKELKELLV